MPLARQVVSQIDHSQIMSSTQRLQERTWLIQGLQQYATYDEDTGAYQELARWCERQWNKILQQQSDNATALKGGPFIIDLRRLSEPHSGKVER